MSVLPLTCSIDHPLAMLAQPACHRAPGSITRGLDRLRARGTDNTAAASSCQLTAPRSRAASCPRPHLRHRWGCHGCEWAQREQLWAGREVFWAGISVLGSVGLNEGLLGCVMSLQMHRRGPVNTAISTSPTHPRATRRRPRTTLVTPRRPNPPKSLCAHSSTQLQATHHTSDPHPQQDRQDVGSHAQHGRRGRDRAARHRQAAAAHLRGDGVRGAWCCCWRC
jgi:hypothetical protein